MQGKIIAIGNLKGGVGKSTVAVNLTCALASDQNKVVLIDADEQGTAAMWSEEGNLPVEVWHRPIETETDGENLIGELVSLKVHMDLILVDLPPHLGDATAAALAVADLFVAPVTPSGADLRATFRALDLMREAREARGDGLPACLLVPSKVDKRTGPGKEIEAVLADIGEPVANPIGQRTAHVDAFTMGMWVGGFESGSLAHGEIDQLAAQVRRMLA